MNWQKSGARWLEEAGQSFHAARFGEAQNAARRAVEAFREERDAVGEGMALGTLGNSLRVTGQVDEAIQCQEQRLAIAKRTGNRQMEGRAHGDIGTLLWLKGDQNPALERFRQHLAIARAITSRTDEGIALGNIGNSLFALSRFDEAIAHQEMSLCIARELRDKQGEFNTLSVIGCCYTSKGDYEHGIEYQRLGLHIAEELQNDFLRSYALGNLGNSYMLSGDYGGAIESFQKCRELTETLKDVRGQAQAEGYLGNIYRLLGDHTKSVVHCERMLANVRKLGDKLSVSKALANLASGYLALGDRGKAYECLSESLALKRGIQDRTGEATVLQSLAALLLDQGETEKARHHLNLALEIFRQTQAKNGEARTLAMFAIQLVQDGQYADAIQRLRECLSLARELSDRPLEALMLSQLGTVAYRTGDLAEAEAVLFSCLDVHESLRSTLKHDATNKVLLADSQQNAYHLLQRVLATSKKYEKALEVAERARTRAFVELIARGKRSPEMLLKAAACPSITDIRDVARMHAATLVEYSLVHSGQNKARHREWDLFTWVVHPTGVVDFCEERWPELESGSFDAGNDMPEAVQRAIGFGGRDAAVGKTKTDLSRSSLREAYDRLLRPIANMLPSRPEDPVVIVPQVFFAVPFPALLDEQGRAVIERHTLLTAPSIHVLRMASVRERAAREADRPAVVVGNPTMPVVTETPLPGLPRAEDEAREVAKLLGCQPLLNASATRQRVLREMPRARVIHLATHGVLGEPSASDVPGAIALAPSQGDNGLLTAAEILDLSLRAELVVLSACNTGQGRLTSDGVIGLSRSFIAAGAAAVLVSLWPVGDAQTAHLMIEFYRHLRTSADKASALRLAMLSTRERYGEHPKHWAGFTLMGDVRPTVGSA